MHDRNLTILATIPLLLLGGACAEGTDCQAVDPLMPACAEAIPHPAEPILVYAMDVGGVWDLYTMNTATGDVRRLTSGPALENAPRWSPDGQRIVFQSTPPGGTAEVFVMDADGTDVRNLTNHPAQDAFPAWSPDGRLIAFHSNRSGRFNIWVMNADGSEPRQLTDHPEQDLHPRWSPDGRRIAFTSSRSGFGQIHVMNADGSDVTPLTWNGGNVLPAWSPDGRYIAFASTRMDDMGNDARDTEIYVMRADGTHQTNLTRTAGLDTRPAWSSTGEIYFVSNRSSPRLELYVMARDGSNVRLLSGGTGHEQPHAR